MRPSGYRRGNELYVQSLNRCAELSILSEVTHSLTLTHQNAMQQSCCRGGASGPQGHQVPAELAMSQQAVVVGGGEEGGVEMAGQSTLRQCQLLHLGGSIMVSLLQNTR